MTDYDSIFTAYYRLFRGESDVPASTDEEYILGLSLANNGLNRWATYDGTYWKELFTNTGANGAGGTLTIATGDTTYACPTAMREPGGEVKVLNADGTTKFTYPIIESQEAQFQDENATYAYFTGNPSTGFTLNVNPAPTSDLDTLTLRYDYYSKPTEYTTGADVSEISNPYFIVHNMLAQRFQIERNYGGYQVAKRDSEELLKGMQMDNNSGTWANPWSLVDNSGAVWGV